MKEKLGILSLTVPYLVWQHLGPTVDGEVVLAIPVIAVVGAVIAAAGVAKSMNAQNKAQDQQAAALGQQQDQIIKTLSADQLVKKAGAILPKFREQAAIGATPAFESSAATQLARLGLDDTGLGAALSTAAGGAGELQALITAVQTAKELNVAQAAALSNLDASQQGGASGSVLGSGLTSLGGGLATSGLGGGVPGVGKTGASTPFQHTARPKGQP